MNSQFSQGKDVTAGDPQDSAEIYISTELPKI